MLREGSPELDELRDVLRRFHAATRRMSADDGEDLAQEALARAVAGGVPIDALPWLRTVARRIAIDKARRARELASGDAADLETLCLELTPGPEDVAVGNEAQRAVREAMDALPDRYREVLLTYAQEGSAATVAEQMGMTPQATWTLLSRARSRLREALEKVGFAPALLIGRISDWTSKAAPTGMAVGMAVAISLSGPATAPPSGQARPVPQTLRAAAAPVSVPTEVQVVADPGPRAPAIVPSPAPVQVPEVVGEVVRHEVAVCVGATGDEQRLEGGLRFESIHPAPLSETLVAAVPEVLHRINPERGCEQ